MMLTLLAMTWYEQTLAFFVVGALICLGMASGKRSKK